jgi:hypothetical protein
MPGGDGLGGPWAWELTKLFVADVLSDRDHGHRLPRRCLLAGDRQDPGEEDPATVAVVRGVVRGRVARVAEALVLWRSRSAAT